MFNAIDSALSDNILLSVLSDGITQVNPFLASCRVMNIQPNDIPVISVTSPVSNFTNGDKNSPVDIVVKKLHPTLVNTLFKATLSVSDLLSMSPEHAAMKVIGGLIKNAEQVLSRDVILSSYSSLANIVSIHSDSISISNSVEREYTVVVSDTTRLIEGEDVYLLDQFNNLVCPTRVSILNKISRLVSITAFKPIREGMKLYRKSDFRHSGLTGISQVLIDTGSIYDTDRDDSMKCPTKKVPQLTAGYLDGIIPELMYSGVDTLFVPSFMFDRFKRILSDSHNFSFVLKKSEWSEYYLLNDRIKVLPSDYLANYKYMFALRSQDFMIVQEGGPAIYPLSSSVTSQSQFSTIDGWAYWNFELVCTDISKQKILEFLT